ncbi:hypothetical protein [Galbibacter sp. BG1]
MEAIINNQDTPIEKLDQFYHWYYNKVKAIHPIDSDTFDRINLTLNPNVRS